MSKISAHRRARVRRNRVHEGLHHRPARPAGADRDRRARRPALFSAERNFAVSGPGRRDRSRPGDVASRVARPGSGRSGAPASWTCSGRHVAKRRADAAGGGAVTRGARPRRPKLTLVERPAGGTSRGERRGSSSRTGVAASRARVVHANAAQPTAARRRLRQLRPVRAAEAGRPRRDRRFSRALREAIVDARVSAQGLDRAALDAVTSVPRVRSVTVTEGAERGTVGDSTSSLPSCSCSAVHGRHEQRAGLLTTTIEEKSSRVIEVLLSAVSPMQLMAGKLLGQWASA